MNLEDYQTIFVSVSLILMLVASSPVIGILLPRNEEPFFAMGILGEGGMAEGYYPGGDPNILVGSLVRWHLYIYNHMGSVQYVAVRVKVLNLTSPSPDISRGLPSPVPAFFELRRVLVKNETWIYPFFWYISKAEYRGNYVVVTQLVLNNVTLDLSAYALNGYNFRMVFELWVYNNVTRSFNFGWESREEHQSVWNQIWFNVTLAK